MASQNYKFQITNQKERFIMAKRAAKKEIGAMEIVQGTNLQNLESVMFNEVTTDPKVSATATANKVTVDVQQEVDEYLKLHAEIAELTAKAEKLKKSVRSFMETNNIQSISGTKGKQVYLQDANASNSTTIYTNFEVQPVMVALNNNDLFRQVAEVRINSNKLDALLKLGNLPKEKVEEIEALKIVNPGTPRFSVKK